ncbi:MAG: hypothetical protein PHI49_08725 [Halothiobacillaceae bacterium]|nr:hypothetical protein [Halothiobacillaceae bacterium]
MTRAHIPRDIIRAMRRRGVTLFPRAGKLVVRPARSLTPDELNYLRQHRDALLAELAHEEATPPNIAPRLVLIFTLSDGGGTYIGDAGEAAEEGLRVLREKWRDRLRGVWHGGERVY